MRRRGPPNGAAGCAVPTPPKQRAQPLGRWWPASHAGESAAVAAGAACCRSATAPQPAVLARGDDPPEPPAGRGGRRCLLPLGNRAAARSASPGGRPPGTPAGPPRRWSLSAGPRTAGRRETVAGMPRETSIMAAWSALPAGLRTTKSARAVTGATASTSHPSSRPSRRWPGYGRADSATPLGPLWRWRPGVTTLWLRVVSDRDFFGKLPMSAKRRGQSWDRGNISCEACGCRGCTGVTGYA
jgi:hypothetical protein